MSATPTHAYIGSDLWLIRPGRSHKGVYWTRLESEDSVSLWGFMQDGKKALHDVTNILGGTLVNCGDRHELAAFVERAHPQFPGGYLSDALARGTELGLKPV